MKKKPGKLIFTGNEYMKKKFYQIHEYARTITALNQTGILTLLPKSDFPRVIEINKKDFPVPTYEQVLETFTHNNGLIDRKL